MDNEQQLEELRAQEKRIENGLSQAGDGLTIIHAQKLYKTTHKSFSSYIKDRWNKSRVWAYTAIKSEKLERQLAPLFEVKNPAQARAMGKVAAPLRPAVVQLLNEMPGKPTAAAIDRFTDKLDTAITTGTIELGDDGQIPIQVVTAFGISLTEDTSEAIKRQDEHIKASQATVMPDYESDLPALEALTATARRTLGIPNDANVYIRIFKSKIGGTIKVEYEAETSSKSVKNSYALDAGQDLRGVITGATVRLSQTGYIKTRQEHQNRSWENDPLALRPSD